MLRLKTRAKRSANLLFHFLRPLCQENSREVKKSFTSVVLTNTEIIKIFKIWIDIYLEWTESFWDSGFSNLKNCLINTRTVSEYKVSCNNNNIGFIQHDICIIVLISWFCVMISSKVNNSLHKCD